MPFSVSLPEEASMIIVAGAGMAFHFFCSLKCGKRCDPGRLIMFAASAAATVAGVYVFFDALTAALNQNNKSVGMQNAVWAGIGGLAVSFFTLDLIIDEIRLVLKKPADPHLITEPQDKASPPRG